MKRVLFLCVHNSARSRMAEGLLNARCGKHFQAESAGLDPGKGVNPLAAEAMRELGIDIASQPAQGVDAVLQRGTKFDYVVTVCHESEAAGCPVFPGKTQRLHWPFEDPSSFTGTWEEKLARTREVRAAIAQKIESWCAEVAG